MKTKLTIEQKEKVNNLEFAWDESQISDQEYYDKLVECVGEENVSRYKMLTGQFPGDTINVIEIK
jgi:hypothetical protein